MSKRLILSAACASLLLQASPSAAHVENTRNASLPTLCAQSLSLAGVEDTLDTRIRVALAGVRGRLDPISAPDDRNLKAFYTAVEGALNAAKAPLLERLRDSCTETFTVEELVGINAFYASDAGKAWIEKGRTVILPVLEEAVSEAEASIRDDVEQRYCAELGLDCA